MGCKLQMTRSWKNFKENIDHYNKLLIARETHSGVSPGLISTFENKSRDLVQSPRKKPIARAINYDA